MSRAIRKLGVQKTALALADAMEDRFRRRDGIPPNILEPSWSEAAVFLAGCTPLLSEEDRAMTEEAFRILLCRAEHSPEVDQEWPAGLFRAARSMNWDNPPVGQVARLLEIKTRGQLWPVPGWLMMGIEMPGIGLLIAAHAFGVPRALLAPALRAHGQLLLRNPTPRAATEIGMTLGLLVLLGETEDLVWLNGMDDGRMYSVCEELFRVTQAKDLGQTPGLSLEAKEVLDYCCG